MNKPVTGNVKIVKLIMIPTKKQYNQVYQRSFTLNATAENLNHIATEFDRIGVKHGNTIPINLMGNTLHNIINVDNLPNQHNNYKYPWYDKGCWNLNYFRNYIERKESDNQSLIYGKYIVASFIFNNDTQKRIKLENVTFNLSKY